MSSRITHVPYQPKIVYYWDYYILCRLNVAAALALQRLEYWDGTKDVVLVPAERANSPVSTSAHDPTRWIYKTQEELRWELMGVTGEKGVVALTRFLQEDLHYLVSRRNPHQALDRKKQYALQTSLLQDHLRYLAALLAYFQERGVHLTLVYAATELLTREQVTLEDLSLEKILQKLAAMRQDPHVPTFLKHELSKDPIGPALLATGVFPFRTFAEWKATQTGLSTPQRCDMEMTPLRDGWRNHTACMSQMCGNNSSNYQQLLPTDITLNEEAETATPVAPVPGPPATTVMIETNAENKDADDAEKGSILLEASPQSAPLVLTPSAPLVNDLPVPPAPFSQGMPARAASRAQPCPVSSTALAPLPPVSASCSDAPCTDEDVVQCWERLRAQPYEPPMRLIQLRAVRALRRLDLAVPLSLPLLQCLYETYFDDFWKQMYGALHLSHLIQVEKSSGQVRIVRWIQRLSLQAVGKPPEGGIRTTPTGEKALSVLETHAPDLSGEATPSQGQGGFERFREGDDPDDDLAAVVKRLQAEGKLPVLAAQ